MVERRSGLVPAFFHLHETELHWRCSAEDAHEHLEFLLVGDDLGDGCDNCPDAPGGQRSTSYGVNIVRGQGQALGFVVTPEDILQRQPGNAVPTDLDVWEFTAVISGTLEGT